jgi:hypothetical protein
MIGEHEGITPLETPEKAAMPALRVLGRLKAGKDVPARKAAIQSAIAKISGEDRYWLETLAAGIGETKGIDSAAAHLAALAAGWELREEEIANLMRKTNDPQAQKNLPETLRTIAEAAPDFRKRLEAGRINSDEVFVRAAFADLFRRDVNSIFHMSVVDSMARQLSKAMKMDVQAFAKSALERVRDEDVPDRAWGFMLVLREMSGRSGVFLMPPEEAGRAMLADFERQLKAFDPNVDDQKLFHNIASWAFANCMLKGNMTQFAAIMSAAAERLGEKYLLLYLREDQGGYHTHLETLPGESVAEARRFALQLPQVQMHDDFRRLTEFIAQSKDLEELNRNS